MQCRFRSSAPGSAGPDHNRPTPRRSSSGFPLNYHMFEVLRNPASKKGHLDFWRKVADEPDARARMEQVFGGYTASVDNPAALSGASSSASTRKPRCC